jgi:anaerobic magnesium-protoporphyrin IX monomethyl ester cyclase
MKISLISLIENASIPGLRYLSAYLRARGHDTNLILLPWSFTDRNLNESNSFLYPYPDEVLEQVAQICAGSDLIGLSLMTCHFDQAIHVTAFLRERLQVPIIWGGIHPTLRPVECLQYADMVCVGEGETSLGLLASEMSGGKRWESLSIPGIQKRDAGQVLPAAPGPLIMKLDELPLPDYDLEHQFILYQGNVVKLNSQMLAKCLGYNYVPMFSRGCPYDCTYCCNNALKKLYGHKLPLRRRSVENEIKELKAAVELMPQLLTVDIGDDSFLSQPLEDVRDFAARYKKEIGLPFKVLSTPSAVSSSKLEALIEAGMHSIAVGIQSSSPRIMDLYHRKDSMDEILALSARIKQVARKQKKFISPRYDLILDNPWETEEDVEANIRFCMKLKRPYFLAFFALTFYPGTELYEKARAEGIVTDDLNQVYRRSQYQYNINYLSGILRALCSNAPNAAISFLLWEPIRRKSPVRLPYRIASMAQMAKELKGFWGYLIRRNWKLIHFLLLIRLSGLRKVEPTIRPRFCGAPGAIAK